MRLRPSDVLSLNGLRIASPLVALAVVAFSGVTTWQKALDSAATEARSRSLLLESQVAGITSAQFVLHDAIIVRLQEIDPSAVRGRPFHEFLKALYETTSRTYGIGLVALDGRLLASSGEYPATSQIEGRAYLEKISEGELQVVDRIVLGRNQVDAMASATAVKVGDTPAALVTAWPVEELTAFAAGLADRPGHQALVMRADGQILVMSGSTGVSRLPIDHMLLAAVETHPVGLLRAPDPTNAKLSFVAYRAVADLPLFVVYAVSMQSIRREWLQAILPFWAFAVAGGLFGFLLFGMVRDSVTTRLRRSLAEQRAAAAENLAQHRKDLLREMTHRIKNNLTIISAIIRVEGRGKSPMQLADLAGRIDAVAAVHDMLYRAEDGVTADLGKLLEAIATNPAILPAELGVDVTLDLRPGVSLDSSIATTVAMITSEIITNSVKHAFLGATDPRLHISMADAGGKLEIIIRDNGPGTPVETARRSGSALMQALASSAGISVTVEVDGGTVHRLLLDCPDRALHFKA
jgi:two-component sensor histidine kinase